MSSSASSSYCEYNDLYLTYGKDNVHKWSDLQNDEDFDDICERMDWAIAKATNYINGRLRKARYAIPFETAPQDVVDMCAAFAGEELFNSRRIGDEEEEINKNMVLRPAVNAHKMLKMILAGQYNLDYALNDKYEAPAVIRDDDDD
jgi:phage gp36-like protein